MSASIFSRSRIIILLKENSISQRYKRFSFSNLNRDMSTKEHSGELRFDGKTAIVTGGARGIGREYVELLASRGANVVINDFGGNRSGEKSTNESSIVDDLALEIQEKHSTKSGKIVSNSESVSDPEGVKRLVESTVKKFGRIDIVINNAGILRDKSFAKMSLEDWDQVQQVHLRGSFLVSHACWPIMRGQSYGRIIMTSSTSGIYGNFGQANYSAAKMGLIGLSNTLAIEGAKNNIHCNVIVPMASSRLTEDIIPQELATNLKPSYVAPMAVWLCHDSCQENGSVFEAAGQWYGRHKMIRSKGKYLPGICERNNSLEEIALNLSSICEFGETSSGVDSFGAHLSDLMSVFESKNK